MNLTRRSFATGIAATGGAAAIRAQGKPGLRAGAATANITPLLGTLLDGTIMQIGPATHVHDELHVRALALDDGATRIAIALCDCTMIEREVLDKAKRLVRLQTGLPEDRILTAATHTHSAPRAIGIFDAEFNKQYLDFLSHRIADSIRIAIDNLAPARIGWGAGTKPEFVHNRRWILKPGTVPADPFGSKTDQVLFNPAGAGDNLVKPAGPVDPEISVLSVQHVDGRPLALLANYATHYAGGFVSGHVSADYFGLFAERVRRSMSEEGQNPPFVGVMSNGPCGDVSPRDWRRPQVAAPPYSKMREMADSVAAEVLRVSKQIEHRDGLRLSMRESEIEVGVRKPDAERLKWAENLWKKADKNKNLSWPEIYARENLLLNEYPSTARLKLQALRIGDLGIAAVPCEVFAETGLAIKKESPVKQVFTIELANGFNGYLPTPAQHALGGYETWPARSSYLEVQAEPKIRAEVLRLLEIVRAG